MGKCMLLFVMIFLASCSGTGNKKEKDKGGSLDKQLIGEWNNLSIKIDINSRNNSDSNEVFAVEQPEWEQKLKIRPIRTFFRADSTWNAAHYNLEDSLVYDPSGTWWLEGDKLVMLQKLPSPDTTVYFLALENDTASFEALLDWDMDGKKDDNYYGRQVKKP